MPAGLIMKQQSKTSKSIKLSYHLCPISIVRKYQTTSSVLGIVIRPTWPPGKRADTAGRTGGRTSGTVGWEWWVALNFLRPGITSTIRNRIYSQSYNSRPDKECETNRWKSLPVNQLLRICFSSPNDVTQSLSMPLYHLSCRKIASSLPF